MSDNSIVTLSYEKDHYEVNHCDVELINTYKKYKGKTLLWAVKKARQIEMENNPEYGVLILKLKGDK